MNKVPHCKECKSYDVYNIGKHTYSNCYAHEVWPLGKEVYASDARTSPQWCPKREIERMKGEKG
jgi:hypothetical protein